LKKFVTSHIDVTIVKLQQQQKKQFTIVIPGQSMEANSRLLKAKVTTAITIVIINASPPFSFTYKLMHLSRLRKSLSITW